MAEIRASTRFGGVVAGSGASVDSLPSSVVTEMNRLSAAGGGRLYLGVYAGTNASVLCGFNTFSLVGETTSPVIGSVTPNRGPAAGGNTVTIAGNDLDGATRVTFGGAAGTNLSASVNEITVTAPAGSVGAVDVVVTTPGGSATASSAYTFIVGPAISSLSPNTGSTSGGYSVTINGTNLINATDVTFGGVPAAIGTRRPNSLEVTVPALNTPRTVDVVVTGPGGTATLTNGFTAIAAPTISSVSPNRGSRGGGQTVTITGTNLTGASAVSFGGAAGSNLIVDSATQLRVTTPVRWDGAMDVVVTTSGGTATLAGGYTFVSPSVTITSPANGGTVTTSTVTVSGTAANATGVEVFLNSVSQGSVTVVNGAWSKVLSGTLGNGGYTVLAQGSDGRVPSPLVSAAFTVAVPPPQIFDRQPTGGPASGGFPVVITGVNFTGATGVTFGNTPATRFTVDSDTQITAIVPVGSGQIDLNVTTPGGNSGPGSSATSFVYIPAPTISAVSPNSGSTSGSHTVTITGTDLDSATSVTFGGVPGVISGGGATELQVITPAHAVGVVNVVVSAGGGTATATGAYTYVAPAPVASSFTYGSAIPYNTGTASPATFSLSGQVTNNPNRYAVGSVTTTQGGSVSINNSGQVTYTPPVGFRGNDSFTYTASNNDGTSLPATVTVTISNPTFTVTLPGAAVFMGETYNASNTPVVISGGKGPYTITSANGYPRELGFDAATKVLSGQVLESGTFTVNFTITDSSTGSGPYSATASATLVASMPPAPTADSFTAPAVAYNTGSASATTIDLTAHVGGVVTGYNLNNGSGGPTKSITTARGGSATVDNTGQVQYTPPVGFRGPDSFEFRPSNPAASGTWVTVTIPVSGPVFTVTLPSATGFAGLPYNASNTPVTIAGGKGPYTVTAVTGQPLGLDFAPATRVLSGTTTLRGDWMVTFVITDSSTGTGPAISTVSTVLTIVNPPAPTASDFTVPAVAYNAGSASATTIDLAARTSGEVGAYGLDQGGILGGRATTANGGVVTINIVTGQVSYTPPVGFRGNDSFRYRADNFGGDTGLITVTVPVDPPTFTVTLPATTGLVGGIYNPSNTPLTISGGKGPYTVTAAAGYPRDLGFDSATQVLSGEVAQTGAWTVTFTITDSSTGAGGFTSTASASLTTSQPPAPTAASFTASAVAYNSGSGTATTIAIAPYASGVITGYWLNNGSGGATPSVATAQGGSASIDNSTGQVSYTPPVGFRGSDSFQYTVVNSGGGSAFMTVTIPVNDPVFTVTLPSATGVVGEAYNSGGAAVTVVGGKAPYSGFSATGLPAGLTISSAGVISGTPTTATGATVVVTATDSSTGSGAYTSTASASLSVAAPTILLSPAAGALPDARAGSPYSQTITSTGGVRPITYAIGGDLPQGVTLSTGGVLSGTPIQTGTFGFTVHATDSSGNDYGGSARYTLTVTAPTIALSPSTLPDGVVGAGYSQALTASGGTAGYSYALDSGPLPAGMSLSTAGVLSGTPTEGGSFPIAIRATDSTAGGTYFGTRIYTLVIGAPTITLSPVALTTVSVGTPVSQTITASGGSSGYRFAVTGGALPAGVSLSTGGVLSGAPTAAGPFSFTVTAMDSSGGAGPYTGEAVYSWTISPPTLSLNPASIPAGIQHSAYSQTITAEGGTPGYGFALHSGSLPTGMSLSTGGILSGTPTQVGAFNITVRTTDSTTGAGPFSIDKAYRLVVGVPAPPTAGDVSQTVAANSSGNVFTLDLSGVPADSVAVGRSPMHGVATVSGMTIVYTPTAGYSGVDRFTYTAINLGGASTPAQVTVTVSQPTLTLGDLPATGEALQAFGGAVTASLGTAPYRFALDGGALPNGVTLHSGGQLSGTPTQAGAFSFTLRATDVYGATGTRNYTLNLAAPGITVGPASLPDGVSAVGYSQALSASGAAAPYRYAVTDGGLPTGMTLSEGGVLSGVAAASGTFDFTVTATDRYGFSGTRAYSVAVDNPVITVTAPAAGALPAGVGGTAYRQTFTAAGGQGAHRFSLTTGALPAGLTLSSGGVLSGTPTVAGTFDFAIAATDASPAPGPFVSTAVHYSLTVAAPSITLTPAAGALPGGLRTVAYSQAFTATGGTGPYSYAVTDGALPDGLTLAADGALSGTPTTAGGNSFRVTVTDAYGFTASAAFTLEVGTPLAVVQPGTLTVVGGQSVTFDASQGAVGLDLIEALIVTGPGHGTVTVKGLIITYAANGTYAGQDSFTYTVRNPGGVSAPATVTITVNPAVVAGPEKTATVLAGQTAVVELTDGAFGAPFTGAAVVSVAPSGAGTATIAGRTEGGKQLYDLSFKPDNSFTGTATVLYTLSNAFTTSEPGKVTITVEARPDPVADAEVSGLITAQSEAARRFATAQIANVNRRLEQLHDGREGSGFSSSFSLSSRGMSGSLAGDPSELRKMQETFGVIGGLTGQFARYDPAGGAGLGGGLAAGEPTPRFGVTDDGEHGPWGVWVSGAATFGRAEDGRDREDFEFSTDGLTIGVDRRLGKGLVLGGAIGWATDASVIGDNGTRSEAGAWSVNLYGGYQPAEKAYFDIVLGYGRLDFDSRRYVTANGDFAYGQRDGDQWYGALTAGWDFRRPKGLHLSPYGRIEATQSLLGSFTEAGGGLYALAYDEQTTRTLTGAVGLRGDFAFKSRLGLAAPSFRIEYSYDLEGAGSQRIRYADWLDGNVYSLDASSLDRNRVLYGLGLDLTRTGGMRLGLDYEGMLSGDQTSSTLRLELHTVF